MNVIVHKIKQSKEEKDTKKDLDEIINHVDPNNLPNNEQIRQIEESLNWKYKYIASSIVPTKTSVSKIKEENQKEMGLEEIINQKQEYIFNIPKFMVQKKDIITSARKGTLMHLCFQKIDKKKDYSKKDIEKLINELVEREIILEEEAKAINVNVINYYTQSKLFKELQDAKEIHEEEPFYLEISANRLSKEYPKDDKILVQGVIDLYYINKNDELVLVDYKTDYIEKGEENKLIDRYKEQIDLYREALEKSLNRKVDKTMIYSTWLGEIVIE